MPGLYSGAEGQRFESSRARHRAPVNGITAILQGHFSFCTNEVMYFCRNRSIEEADLNATREGACLSGTELNVIMISEGKG